jgi:hypothetical protein
MFLVQADLNSVDVLECYKDLKIVVLNVVEGAGFEPAKAEPSDLQSDPFGRSGTPPLRGAYTTRI